MATRAEVIQQIERRLVARQYEELTWSDITQVVSTFTPAIRTQLVEHAKYNNSRKFTNIVFQALRTRVTNKARAEAQTMMADDTLTLVDLQRFL